MSENPKKIYVRILTAVIQVDENGNEEATPACIDIPVAASSVQEATKLVANALTNLVPQPMDPKDYADMMKAIFGIANNPPTAISPYSRQNPYQGPWISPRKTLPQQPVRKPAEVEQKEIWERLKEMMKKV